MRKLRLLKTLWKEWKTILTSRKIILFRPCVFPINVENKVET